VRTGGIRSVCVIVRSRFFRPAPRPLLRGLHPRVVQSRRSRAKATPGRLSCWAGECMRLCSVRSMRTPPLVDYSVSASVGSVRLISQPEREKKPEYDNAGLINQDGIVHNECPTCRLSGWPPLSFARCCSWKRDMTEFQTEIAISSLLLEYVSGVGLPNRAATLNQQVRFLYR